MCYVKHGYREWNTECWFSGWLRSSYALSSPVVNEGMVKQVSNFCPDPGEPENGKRVGADFRYSLSLSCYFYAALFQHVSMIEIIIYFIIMR